MFHGIFNKKLRNYQNNSGADILYNCSSLLTSRLYCRLRNLTGSCHLLWLAGFTAGRESHPAPKNLYSTIMSVAQYWLFDNRKYLHREIMPQFG